MTSHSKNKKPQRSVTHPKYIFVVGGVMSGVGKGVASSSIGTIMQARGLKVTALKIDPYINVDAGTMNPTEHGEVFVLKDGDETDQDMGNYERFLNVDLDRTNYMTTGRVYQSVIERERNLGYEGKNVEVVPDIPKEVNRRIKKAQKEAAADITIVEIGGTVGEYQNIIFLEAARMLQQEHPEDVAIVMVSYLPTPAKVGEMKTKPTQYAARTLFSSGLIPDVIIARSDVSLDEKRKQKIATFCNVKKDHVISAPDVDSIYDVPLNFERDHLGKILCETLDIACDAKTNLRKWKSFVTSRNKTTDTKRVAIVGKYFSSGDFVLPDVYLSIIEAIKYSAYKKGIESEISYLSSLDFENNKQKVKDLSNYDGVIVPGGFGSSGIEGKIAAIQHVRENNIPYLGICYGMQLAAIEFARNVAGIKSATTTEIDPNTAEPIIDIMPEQKKLLEHSRYGGSMRLGSYPCDLLPNTHARGAYRSGSVVERHRHRYELNNNYREILAKAGMIFSGLSPDGKLVEILELPEAMHPFFVASQFHPEFQARPLAPHPLFTSFISHL